MPRWIVFTPRRVVLGTITAPDYQEARSLAWAMYETPHVSLAACEYVSGLVAIDVDYRADRDGRFTEIMFAVAREGAR